MARKNERTDLVTVAEVMEAGADDLPLRGKSFSITGHLSKPRDAIVALIEQAGGTFHKAPAWGTTYLITNADWSGDQKSSKKLEKARASGVKLINEQTFLDMLTKTT